LRTSRPSDSRAAASACKPETLAVSYTTPKKFAGRPSASRSHLSATSSTSVAAGDVRHSIPLTLSAAASNSASTAGSEPVIEK